MKIWDVQKHVFVYKCVCVCVHITFFGRILCFLGAHYQKHMWGLHWHRKDCHVTSTLQDVEQKKTVMCTQTQTHLNTNTYFKHKHKHMFLQHIGNIIAVCKDSYVVVVLTKTGNHSQNQNDIEKMTLQKWHCKNDVTISHGDSRCTLYKSFNLTRIPSSQRPSPACQ